MGLRICMMAVDCEIFHPSSGIDISKVQDLLSSELENIAEYF